MNISKSCWRDIRVNLVDLRRAAEILDSCYRMYDDACVKHAVKVLAFEGIEAVMVDDRLLGICDLSREILREALENLNVISSNDKIEVYYLHMDAYVTSYIGRLLAREYPDKIVILVHEIPRVGGGFIYLRSMRRSLKGLIKDLRDEGVKVGGKETVAVIEFLGGYRKMLRKVINGVKRNL